MAPSKKMQFDLGKKEYSENGWLSCAKILARWIEQNLGPDLLMYSKNGALRM